MPPDEPVDEEQLEELPEDYETPFRPVDTPKERIAGPDGMDEVVEELDSTYPQTDTNMIEAEWYDEGIPGAAEASEPNAADTVIGYDPTKDTRRKQADETEDNAA